MNDLTLKAIERLSQLDRELRDLLTPAQLEVVRTFSPCVIPPRELKDPVRVGQAAGELDDVLQEMDHVRRLPREAAARLFSSLALDRLDDWSAMTRSAPADARRREVERLREILERAHSLDSTAYGLRREDLARELTRGRLEFAAKELAVTERYDDIFGALPRTARFLLNPRAAALLDEKLRSAPTSPARASDERAPICRDSSCAQDPWPTEESTRCRCGAPTTAYVARLLGLDAERRKIAARILSESANDAWRELARPRSDGRNVVHEMYSGTPPADEVLALRAPGTEETYAEILDRIARIRDERLERWLTPQQREVWLANAPGVLEVEE
ncbi:MAG: hypothetical protein HYY17_08420 [Planctomycetes bacterium]|nr:hypothetical protein [Planctomycetota bacterium]